MYYYNAGHDDQSDDARVMFGGIVGGFDSCKVLRWLHLCLQTKLTRLPTMEDNSHSLIVVREAWLEILLRHPLS